MAMNFKKTAEENKTSKKSTKGADAPMNFSKTAKNKKDVTEPNTKGKPMNIPKIEITVTPKMNFKTAFAQARKKFIAGGGKESDYVFTWEGNKYNILRGDDKGKSSAEKKASLKKQIAEMKKGGKAPRGASVTKAQAKKIVSGNNVGGLTAGSARRKVNPTTGMAMKGGGWATKNNKLKTGMAKGGMARSR